MRFLIMGALKPDIMDVNEIEFIEACHQLGMKLAERNHTIIISACDPLTADFHVLEGVDKVPGHHPVILLQSSEETNKSERAVYVDRGYQPEGEDPQDLSRFKNIDLQTQIVVGRWPGNRIQAISKAEAVIIIGGRFGVATVGVSAPLLKTPVVAIGSFGGAAREILDEVSFHYGQAGISADDVRTLRSGWSRNTAAVVIKVAEALVTRNPFRQDQVSQLLVVFLILVLLIAWVSLYRLGGRSPNDVILFGLLGISALVGTGLRTELRVLANEMSLLSTKQITVEAIVGILLAFIFCLLYLAGNFVLTGTFITLQDKPANDFSRVAITLSILGISTAFLLEPAVESLRKRLGEIITTTPK